MPGLQGLDDRSGSEDRTVLTKLREGGRSSMTSLYLCGVGNPEGVRLALTINGAEGRWDRIMALDDDPSTKGKFILGVEIVGPFSVLEQVDPASTEVANLVARTTRKREAAKRRIQEYGLPFASLIAPDVDSTWVELGDDLTVYPHASLYANSRVGEGSVVFGGAIAGHASRVGRCCVVAPGAVINARVELAEGVYVGTNASILPDLKIGAWATIGANSAVLEDVPAGATVMGVPAQILIPGGGEQSGQAPGRPAGEQQDPDSQVRGGSDALRQLRVAQRRYIESYKSDEGLS
jgi:sugar O-acyltransferase (sialic acid O-acetyltransferase NeuD family)